ncbi:TetR family transcriptional regulator [Acrocarpospora corrugata]|uniref:TetR family transcriptional regulator n=1 Tax=Acrocarpospora corrugata TaxID=35763 RepID=A0A5M3VP74_9ACTN|nr:TetR/AcrR family transcriptional regulator [Acrocarpospora corrugata]GER98596.1 TetR family transcriptional regulator [Acrocarpospora corrugata]
MAVPTRNRRDEILEAAANLFAARGFHGVSIEDIGAAVGITGPALYRHFRGKEALLSQILLDISARLHDQGAATASLPPPEALHALLTGHIDFALSHPALIRVHERELHNVPELARRQIRRLQRLYVEEWVTVLRDLHPAVPPVRLRSAAHAVLGLINSTPRSAGELPAREMAELLHRMALAALTVSGD